MNIKWQFCTLSNFFITGGPKVRFGTKWPSITSTCIISAPPFSKERISSLNLLKSADKIEGEIFTSFSFIIIVFYNLYILKDKKRG